jgi:hypothetical protein
MEESRMSVRRVVLVILAVAVVAAGIFGWIKYRQVRADYDAYRSGIQAGVHVAGVNVGWKTPQEAREKVWEQVAAPYYRDFALRYQDRLITLSPDANLDLQIPVEEMVDEAMAASHRYDYWEGFRAWIQGQAFELELDVPLRMSFDSSAAAGFLKDVAQQYDVTVVEPLVDVEALAFYPGQPGSRLDVAQAAKMVNEQVTQPGEREIDLPLTIVEPDQSRARITSMLSTLGPVMEREPTPPHYYTATLPISTTGGIEGTPTADYSGPLTWTLPYFAAYTGPLTETTGFFFDPGEPGYTFNVTRATTLVDLKLRAGMTEPISFEPELVPPPPLSKEVLLPPLKERLAQFPGITSILVKNLDTGEVLYESNVDYILSGMSVVKIGIMVEVYRHFGGEVDAQTHQEMLDMLGSESCNPCANRLLAVVGGGSRYDGAARVTQTMRRLGLDNFYLCAPFREVRWDDGTSGYAQLGSLVWTANSSWLQESQKPGYDPCVRATPREMAKLLEMIYLGSQDEGLLHDAYPNIFTPQVCQDMVDIMAANDLRNMLGSGIPAEVKLAHKHGFSGYAVSWGDTRAEVGIVFSPGANWLISFYIWQDTDWINWGINQPLYRDVSNMLYNYFNPTEPYWPLPPWAPEPETATDSDSDA